jgi:hypothetical protein
MLRRSAAMPPLPVCAGWESEVVAEAVRRSKATLGISADTGGATGSQQGSLRLLHWLADWQCHCPANETGGPDEAAALPATTL